MNQQKGLIGIIIIVFVTLVISLVLGYMFLAKLYTVSGDKVVLPFKPGELLLGEGITYLFRKPTIGDRVVFTPENSGGLDFIGIITQVENKDNVTVYAIISTGKGVPWTVSIDKIKKRIYFPFIDQKETGRYPLN